MNLKDFKIIINLYLTEQCNLKCKHCLHYGSPDKKDSHMTEDELGYFFEFMSKVNNINVISLTGGEPMLHPKFYKVAIPIVIHKMRTPPFINLCTNGIIKPDERYNSLLQRKFTNIFIGHDSFHNKFRKINECYLDELSQWGTVILRKIGNDSIYYVRNMGRARNLKYPIKFRQKNCVQWHDPNGILLNFAHNHIRFCCENSHDYKNIYNFVEYDDYFLENPQSLLELALDYKYNHSNENCLTQCEILTLVNK